MVKTAKIEEAIKQDTEMNLRSKHDSDGPNPDNAEKLCSPHVGGWSTSDHSGQLKAHQYINSDGRTSKLSINIAWPLCHRIMKEKKYSSQSFYCLLAYFGTLSAIQRKKGAAVQTFCLTSAELIIQNG